MSEVNKYAEEVQQFSGIVDDLTKELRSFKSDMKRSMDVLGEKLDRVKSETDVILEGDNRHGVLPIRETASRALKEAERANERLNKLFWTVGGLAGGGSVGGSYLFNLIQNLM